MRREREGGKKEATRVKKLDRVSIDLARTSRDIATEYAFIAALAKITEVFQTNLKNRPTLHARTGISGRSANRCAKEDGRFCFSCSSRWYNSETAVWIPCGCPVIVTSWSAASQHRHCTVMRGEYAHARWR